jgi:uncharacterized membrane protein
MKATIENRIRLSAVLVIIGLLVEGVTLMFVHPIAFLTFTFIGCLFLGAGVLLYLYSVVSLPTAPPPKE